MAEAAAPLAAPLRERLRDPEEGIRLGAAAEAYLAERPPAECQAELARLLSEPGEDGRKLAALALGRIGPSAFPDLAKALDPAQPPAVRAVACQAGAAHGPDAAPLAGAICACLRTPDGDLLAAASVSAGRVGGASVGPLSRILDESDEAATLVAAADACGAIGKDAAPAAEPLKRASGHRDGRVAMACADALGRVSGRPASALPALVSAASANDPAVRAEAVRRIGALQREGRGASKTLLERGDDPDPKVRAAATTALALVGVRGEELLGALERRLSDPEPDVRVAAAAAAAHAREETRPLLPTLGRLRDDPEPRVAAAAGAACDALEGKEPPKAPARVPLPA